MKKIIVSILVLALLVVGICAVAFAGDKEPGHGALPTENVTLV